MKSLSSLSNLILCIPLLFLLCLASTAYSQDLIEVQGRRVTYQGENIKKVKDLAAIIQKAENEEANNLMQQHQSNVRLANVVGWTGVGVSAVGLIIQLDSFSSSDAFDMLEQNNRGYAIVLGGGVLTIVGALIATGSWKRNGKKAVDLFNESSGVQKDGVSFQLTPAKETLGLRFGVTF